MYQEGFFLSRSIETYRVVEDESCEDCHLRRSNAVRRKKGRRPMVSTLKRVQSARKNFEKCIEKCGVLESVEEIRTTKGFKG